MQNGKQRLTDLERKREAIIAQNRARFEKAGVLSAVQRLNQSTPSASTTKKRESTKRKSEAKEENKDLRRQTRSQTGSIGKQTRSQDAESALGQFIVTGICPKCNKSFSRNHRRHFIDCRDIIQTKLSPLKSPLVFPKELQKQRIQQVKANKLISVTSDEAKFFVIGSTGNKYTVTLSDGKQSCECMDHRIRRRACKHIKALILRLQILDNPDNWREVIKSGP